MDHKIIPTALLKHELLITRETALQCWETYGLSKYVLGPPLVRPFISFLNQVFLLLDVFFLRRYKKVRIEKPVFITGHPRSGTTFLHRTLTSTDEFSCFKFWHTYFPSLFARTAFSPIANFLIQKQRDAVLVKDSGHSVALDSTEEEEFLFLKSYNSPMATLFLPLAFSAEDHWELFYFEKQPEVLKNEMMRLFEGCMKRQLYYLKRSQVLAKMPYAMLRFQSIMNHFPDAKFVYLIRSPFEVIPSYLSLITEILERFWSVEQLSETGLRRIYQRAYEQSIRYYQWVDMLENTAIANTENFMTLPYSLLKTDLLGAVENLLEFTQMPISKTLRGQIAEASGKQKAYRSVHRNRPFEEFGFSKDRVAQDFAFVLEKYGF